MTCLSETDGWAAVEYEDGSTVEEGYIKAEYLSDFDALYYTTDRVNLRETPPRKQEDWERWMQARLFSSMKKRNRYTYNG